MLRKLCKVVLLLLVLLAVLTPLLQLDSWDKFPVSSDDIEAQTTHCLCFLGMVLIFTGILKLIPVLLRSIVPVVVFSSANPLSLTEDAHSVSALTQRSTPLRI